MENITITEFKKLCEENEKVIYYGESIILIFDKQDGLKVRWLK